MFFFEKINKAGKPLDKLTKKKKSEREKTKITKIRNEIWNINIYPREITRIILEYYEQICAQKVDNWHEIDKFLEIHELLKTDPRGNKKSK